MPKYPLSRIPEILIALEMIFLSACSAARPLEQTVAVPTTPDSSSQPTATLPPTLKPTATTSPTETAIPTDTSLPAIDTPTPSPMLMPPLSGSGGGVLAFVAEQGGIPRIYLMNADGSDQSLVTDQFDTNPAWSPEGNKLAFTSHRSNTIAIYVIDLTTGKLVPFTRTKRSPSQPDWSPDGKKIAYIDNPAHPAIDYELFVINADGSNPRQLTDSAGYQTYVGPAWSPDGSRLIVTSDQNGNFDIFLIDPDGSNLQQLTFTQANERSPAWSPDGTRIAFESNRDGNWEIYVMNSDGSGVQRLTDDPGNDLAPDWSSDGSLLAFQTDRDGNWEIYLMAADGSNPTRLTNNEWKDAEPTWKP
jgi:Tol biopolymer transport system component